MALFVVSMSNIIGGKLAQNKEMFTDSEEATAGYANYCRLNYKTDNRCPGFCKENPNSPYCRMSS